MESKVTSNLNERIGILEVSALERWVNSRCGVHFHVTFDPYAETAYVTNSGKMVIPSPNPAMTLRDAIRLRGFCLHEAGHPQWQPQIWDVMKKYPTPQGHPLGGLYNLFLDVHSETLTANMYEGDAKALSQFAVIVGRDVTEKLTKGLKVSGGVFPNGFDKMAGVMICCRDAEGSWNTGMRIGFDSLIRDIYTEEMREIAADVKKHFDLEKLLVTNASDIDEWGIWDLSKRVYEHVWGKDAEEPPEEGVGGGRAKPTPDASDGSSDEDKPDVEPEEGSIKVTDIFNSDHYETMTGGGNGMSFDYSSYSGRGSYTPVDPKTFVITKFGR